MAVRRDRIGRAFDSVAWQEGARAFFDATGLSLTVLDLVTLEAVATTGRCGHCHLLAEGISPGPVDCFDAPPADSCGMRARMCRGGIATLLAPVAVDGTNLVHVMVSGFVSSTRERKKLYERLMGRGVREEVARLAVRGLPMVSRREIEAYARLACATANSVVSASDGATAGSAASCEAGEAVGTLLDTNAAVGAVAGDPRALAPLLLDGALALFGAQAGTVALGRSGGYVEVVASAGEGVRPHGTRMRLEGGAAARAMETGRTAVIASERSASGTRRATVVAALATTGRRQAPASAASGSRAGDPGRAPAGAVGTLELRFDNGAGLVAHDLRRIERFARYTGLTIGTAERHVSLERSLVVAARADELAASLGSETDEPAITERVLSTLERVLGCDVVGVIISGWGRDQVDAALACDVTSAEFAMVAGEVAGRDVEKHPYETASCRSRGGELVLSPEVRDGWTFISAPLSASDRLVGFLFAASMRRKGFSAHDARLLDGLARHTAAAFERAELLRRVRDDLAVTVATLSSSLDSRAGVGPRRNDTRPAAPRVMEYAMLIGEELDLEMEQLERLRFAGLLHDFGTTGVTEEVVLTPIEMSDDELQRVRMHTELGVTVMEQIELIRELTPIILHHHERWDGSGTPSGLSGQAIPLLARILCVADSFDAMASGRHRGTRVSLAGALAELEARAGTVYDPGVVAALSSALNRQALAGAAGVLLAPDASDGRRDLPA